MRREEHRGETGNKRGGTEQGEVWRETRGVSPLPQESPGWPEEAELTRKAAARWPCLPVAFQTAHEPLASCRRRSRYSLEHAGGLKEGRGPSPAADRPWMRSQKHPPFHCPPPQLSLNSEVSVVRGLLSGRGAGLTLVGFAPQDRVWNSRGPLRLHNTGRWEKKTE